MRRYQNKAQQQIDCIKWGSETVNIKQVFAALNGLFLVFMMLSFCLSSYAQTAIAFTPSDLFTIPSQDSTLRFATNGTYTSATLQNGTWTFMDLNLTYATASFLGLNVTSGNHTLRFSASNCNVTILAYQTFNYTAPVSIISYSVKGEGTQTVDLGLNAPGPTDRSEWSIIVDDNVFLAEGQGWQLLPDDSIVVSAPAHNITIVHFSYRDSGLESLSFLFQHYVLLFAGLVLAAIVAVSIVLRMRRRQRAGLETQISN